MSKGDLSEQAYCPSGSVIWLQCGYVCFYVVHFHLIKKCAFDKRSIQATPVDSEKLREDKRTFTLNML